MSTLIEDLRELESAEDFLEFFDIVYEQRVVDVYRLMILQSASGLLDDAELARGGDNGLFERFRRRLQDAYAECRDGTIAQRSKPAVAPSSSGCIDAAVSPGAVFVPLTAVMGLRRPRPD